MKTKEQLILEATSPEFLINAQSDSGTIARVLARCDSGTIARVLARCDSGTIARVLALGDSGTIDRVLARCDSGTIARVLARCDSGTIARVLARCDSGTIARVKKNRAKLLWEKPYTNLLSAIRSPGNALRQATWHTCETTHCIAGWTVTKAPYGKELEALLETGPAARAILLASRPDAPLPRFDSEVSEEAIMAFVEARAEEEK